MACIKLRVAILAIGIILVATQVAASEEQCFSGGCAATDRSLLQRSASSVANVSVPSEVSSAIDEPVEELEKVPTDQEKSTDLSLCESDVFARPELCPAKCPYAAEMQNEYCHFRCVKRRECGTLNTVANATIPDDKLMVCRTCDVEACLTCKGSKPGAEGEKAERCLKCMPGYFMTAEGECQMLGLWIFVIVGVVCGVGAVVALIWYIYARSHPFVNEEGVQYALECRARSMLTMPGTSEPYPITTNMMTNNVAGPGTMALFRFEFAAIVWACVLFAVWMGFAVFVSSDILILGNRAAASPQLLCAVVAWGHRRQMELIWTKCTWLAFAYVFSFVGAICYGVQQTKMFARVDQETADVSDYVAVLEGLPEMRGDERVEDKLKEAIVQATREEVVGVSVAWDFSGHKDAVMHALEDEEPIPAGVHGPEMNGMCGMKASSPSRSSMLGMSTCLMVMVMDMVMDMVMAMATLKMSYAALKLHLPRTWFSKQRKVETGRLSLWHLREALR